MNRALYLVAYDVSCPVRLRRALEVVRDYSLGGQKSVFECYLLPAERAELIQRLQRVLDLRSDRCFLLRLDPRSHMRAMGIGSVPRDASWFYIG